MKLDPQQTIIKNELEKLVLELEKKASSSIIKKMISSKPRELKSLYIHGDVGRGKTMLMRGFYDSVKKTPKIYVHFNSFMRSIHEALRDIRKEEKEYKDELIETVRRVVKKKKLICFDEFQVVDIADAMLLARIFSYLFSQGVVSIFTSNTEPLELYKNGLQREVFMDFVKNILVKKCHILNLDSPTDYRVKLRKSLTKRYFIFDQDGCKEIDDIIIKTSEGQKPKVTKLNVWGREVKIKRTYGRSAVMTFEELCCQPFSASDYQTICQNFDLIFLLDLPILTPDEANEMRRFMLFIDEVYENKVTLITLAEAEIDKLCKAKLFKRTASRLNEIGSESY